MSCISLIASSPIQPYLARPCDLEQLDHTLKSWSDFIARIADKIEKPPEIGILEDYKCVLHMIQDDVQRQQFAKDRSIFIVKSGTSTEGVSSCHSVPDPVSGQKQFLIDTILTAPWNLNFSIFTGRVKIKGVGTLLVSLMLEKAAELKADIVKLESTGSSIPFYKKIGFSLMSFNKFRCDPKDECLQIKLKEIITSLFKSA